MRLRNSLTVTISLLHGCRLSRSQGAEWIQDTAASGPDDGLFVT